ncbi:MAG: hypothetical protein GWO20_03385 [Candidatus Korarchaeota archaeon]|nr:hypothetical protein [Candidatus Korarchaeota archaeon]NIU81917.1 hypothetical protein [Candidatus Thorarchaeota archaeon]NIW12375.1 hypothetical protein [Candidatus Thorarchaeota archaeon]NIW51167.1 hypothetical protein [Candidatus Korarchaeota archaeon]
MPSADSGSAIQESKERAITIRGISLALVLNVIFTLVNTYLGISLGMGFGFSAAIVLIAFASLKNAKKEELTFVTIASQSYTIWWLMAMGIFLRMNAPNEDLPTWLIPSKEVLTNGSLFNTAWIKPFLTVTFLSMSGIIISLLVGIMIADKALEKEEMKFPMFQVTATTINAIMSDNPGDDGSKGNASSRLLFKWLGIGVILVVLQLGLANLGYPTQTIDLTNFFRQYGTSFGLSLMLVFVGVGIIISPRTSLTTFGAGLFIYLALVPLAYHFGFLSVPPEAYIPLTGQTPIMSFYNWILYNFLLSPALGVILLGPLIPSILGIILQKKGGDGETQHETLGFGEFLRNLFSRLLDNKLAGFLFFSLTVGTVLFVVLVSIFALPFWITLALALLIVGVGFIDTWIMTRMMGEVGMTMGAHRLVFYEIPLATSGVRNWKGYLTYPSVNPWSTGGIIGFTKMARMTGTPKSSIIKAYLFRLIPGLTVSTLTTVFLWYTLSFPSIEIPGVPLYQNYVILQLFVGGNVRNFVNPIVMIVSGAIAGLLTLITPISIMGMSFAMFLPISYTFPIGLGGIIRLTLDKKKGKEWFSERGRIIVSGFIAGATISQILMSITFLFI